MNLSIEIAERRWVPDPVLRAGVRRLIKERLADERELQPEAWGDRYQALVDSLRESPIALETGLANDQHYEVPAGFFAIVLGRHLKYSCGYWDGGAAGLDDAEQAMLELYAERLELRDGQTVLDLGCGWGSFTLWAAARYPGSMFTAVSNSGSQREYIVQQLRARGLANVSVVTADVNELQLPGAFDRVLSIEMFEHVRNYARLLERIAGWLNADGKLFVHIFCHRNLLYPFETAGEHDWMARHFFSGGLMPALDTLLHFQDHLRIERRWNVSGINYRKTARAWLDNLDAQPDSVTRALLPVYGEAEVARWVQRWRMFFIACEEMFGYRDGREWFVAHYRFGRRP